MTLPPASPRHLFVGLLLLGALASPAPSQEAPTTRPTAAGKALIRVLRGHDDGVLCAAFSPDDRYVVTGSADKTARVWDVASGAERFRLEGHLGMVTCVAWSANGSRIATAGPDRTARVWDAATGELVAILRGHKNHVHTLAISPDGSRVVTGSCDRSAICWDVATEKPLCVIGLPTYCRCVAVSPDGRRLLVGVGNDEGPAGNLKPWKPGQDCSLIVCDLPTGNEVTRIEHAHVVTFAGWSADGSQFLTISSAGLEYQQSFRIFDATSFRQIRAATIATDTPEEAIAFTTDFRRFLLQGLGGVTLREFGSGRVIGGFPKGRPTHDLAFSHDAKFGLVASGGNGDPYGRYRVAWKQTRDNVVRIFDLGVPTQTTVRYTEDAVEVSPGRMMSADATCITPSPDGTGLLVGYGQGMMRLFDSTSGKPLGHFVPPPRTGYPVRGGAFSPDGRTIAAAAGMQTVRLWNIQSGAIVREMHAKAKRIFYNVAFSPDGKYIFAGTFNGSGGTGAVMFDASDGAEVRLFLGHKEPIEQVLVSRDGKLLATCTRGGWGSFKGADRKPAPAEIAVWDVDTGRLVKRFDPQSDHFAGAAFLRGHLLAIACDDVVHLWDADTGSDRLIEEHGGTIRSIAASADGSQLLSVAADQLALVTDADTGEVRQRLVSSIQFNYIARAIFLPDGSPAVVSGSAAEPLVLEPLGP